MPTGDRSDSPLSRELAEALRGHTPDARDVERAYRRFAIHRDANQRPLRAGRWLMFGFVAGWAVVAAATGEPFPGYRALRQPNVVEPSALKPKPRLPAALPASAAPVLERPTPSASAVVRRSPVASFPLQESSRDPKWQRAARALREHDYAEAQVALDELEQSQNPSDAEAASLALSQVYVARGRGRDARARLERLVTSARSPLVRDKARVLLEEIDAGDRSPAAPAATKVP